MRKLILILIFFLIFIGIIFAFLHFFKPKHSYINETLKAVPLNTSLLVEINDFSDFFDQLKNNKIYKEIIEINDDFEEKSLIHYYFEISKTEEIINDLCTHSSVMLSFHILGKSKLEQLLIISLALDETEKNLSQNLLKYFEKVGSVRSRNYDSSIIYEVENNNISSMLYYTVYKGLLISSYSSLLVENSIRQLDNNITYISDITEFDRVYQTAGRNEVANIYINKSQLSEILNIILDNKYSSTIGNLKNFGTWTELDLSMGSNYIYLNGFSAISDTVMTFLNVIETQSHSNISSTKILSDGTCMYLAIAINNIARYDQFLSKYLNLNNRENRRDDKISEIYKKTNVDIKKTFYPLVNNEICLAITNVNILDIHQNAFIIMGLRSRSQAENEIINMLKIASKKLNTSYHDYIDDVKIDDSHSIKVYELPFENTGELLFGPMFGICSAKYIGFIENFLVFANSKEALLRLTHDAILNRTMKTSINHNKFLNNFSSRSNLFLYFSTFSGSGIIQNYLANKYLRIFNNNIDNFINLGSMGYQITKSQNMMYNNLVITHSEEVSERPLTVWESRLDTTINMKPAIVINHNNNAREIVIQDLNNNLYLLSASGREIWRIQLDEEITSQIYQVDYYNNNRLQLLFSTKTQIHLIDRLGNYVERYPVNLRANATAPLALFDYYNNKNYRIFIPCEDNKVYLYDIKGNIIKGWDFENTENIVTSQVSFYRFDNKDYIVFNDNYKAYILNRRGEERIRLNKNFRFSPNNKIWLDDLSNSDLKFVATDVNGTIMIIDEKGSVDSVKIKNFSKNHFFSLFDVNRNGINDYVFLDKNKLEVYTKNKKLLFEFNLPEKTKLEPSFYHFPGNKIKIGVVCQSTRNIYLINHDGSIFNGFPLQGLSQFSIGYLSGSANKFNLIVGGPNNLLYNYEVTEN